MDHLVRSGINAEFEHMIEMTRKEDSRDEEIKRFLIQAQRSFGSTGEESMQGPHQRSLLHFAAQCNAIELTRYLLRKGTAVDMRDQYKRTPLSWAAEHGADNAARLLLDLGAKVNSIDECYTSPLTWLIEAGNGGNLEATKDLLKSRGARRTGAIRAWILSKLHLL